MRPRSGSYQRRTDRQVRTTDPDAAPMRTGGELRLGSHDHYVVDGGSARIILPAFVTPADVWKVTCEGVLVAAGQNRKRWLTLTGWGRRHGLTGSRTLPRPPAPTGDGAGQCEVAAGVWGFSTCWAGTTFSNDPC